MDSYSRSARGENGEEKGDQQAATGKLRGSSPLDTFESQRSSRLNSASTGKSTRRLSSQVLGSEKALAVAREEVEKGKVLVARLEGRIAVLRRASHMVARPLEIDQICQGISVGEANFTKQVALELKAHPAVSKRVQVALYQFEQALTGLKQMDEALEKASCLEGKEQLAFLDENLHIEKLRGQLYPLANFHIVFKDNALIGQLIPTPKVVPQPIKVPPPPPEPVAPPAPSTSGSLADDPAVKEVIQTFQKITGSLKSSFSGLFGGSGKLEN